MASSPQSTGPKRKYAALETGEPETTFQLRRHGEYSEPPWNGVSIRRQHFSTREDWIVASAPYLPPSMRRLSKPSNLQPHSQDAGTSSPLSKVASQPLTSEQLSHLHPDLEATLKSMVESAVTNSFRAVESTIEQRIQARMQSAITNSFRAMECTIEQRIQARVQAALTLYRPDRSNPSLLEQELQIASSSASDLVTKDPRLHAFDHYPAVKVVKRTLKPVAKKALKDIMKPNPFAPLPPKGKTTRTDTSSQDLQGPSQALDLFEELPIEPSLWSPSVATLTIVGTFPQKHGPHPALSELHSPLSQFGKCQAKLYAWTNRESTGQWFATVRFTNADARMQLLRVGFLKLWDTHLKITSLPGKGVEIATTEPLDSVVLVCQGTDEEHRFRAFLDILTNLKDGFVTKLELAKVASTKSKGRNECWHYSHIGDGKELGITSRGYECKTCGIKTKFHFTAAQILGALGSPVNEPLATRMCAKDANGNYLSGSHLCGNATCIRPSHVHLETNLKNAARKPHHDNHYCPGTTCNPPCITTNRLDQPKRPRRSAEGFKVREG